MDNRSWSARLVPAIGWALGGVALITLVMAVRGLMPYRDPAFANYDHMTYLAMAEQGIGSPGKASVPPFCWRILTPWIAGELPLPAPAAFFVITWLSVVGATVGVYLLVVRRGHAHRIGVLAQLAFLTFFWAVGQNIWSYLMVDALTLVLLIAGLIVLQERSWTAGARCAALGLLLVLGALAKESYLMLAAAAGIALWREPGSSRAARAVRALVTIAPAVLVMLAVRRAIHPDLNQPSEFPGYSLLAVAAAVVRSRLAALPQWAMDVLVDPWGPLVVTPAILSPLVTLSWWRRRPELSAFAALGFAQTLVGTSGGRLAVLAAPAVILFLVEGVELFAEGSPGWRGTLALLFTLQFVFEYLRRTTLGFSIPPYAPNVWVTAAHVARGLSFVAFIAVWMTRGTRRGHAAAPGGATR